MTYQGKIENGQVVFANGMIPPEGSEVTVIVAKSPAPQDDQVSGSSLAERLKGFIGTAKSLPPDASINVDHYLYGLPKK